MTKTTVAAFSGAVSSVKMLDTDHDGKVDEIDVLFTVTVLCTASCTNGWSVSNIPSGGTLSSVTVSSNTAKLMIAEGAGAADTVGRHVDRRSRGPGRDHRLGGTLRLVRFDHSDRRCGARAHEPRLAPESAGTAGNGKMEAGDKFVVTFSEPVAGVDRHLAVSRDTGPGQRQLNLTIVGFTHQTAEHRFEGLPDVRKNTADLPRREPGLGSRDRHGDINLGAVRGTRNGSYFDRSPRVHPAGTIKDPAGNAAAGTLPLTVDLF